MSCDKRHRPSMPLPRPSPVLKNSASQQRTSVNVMPWLRRWEFDRVVETSGLSFPTVERIVRRTWSQLAALRQALGAQNADGNTVAALGKALAGSGERR